MKTIRLTTTKVPMTPVARPRFYPLDQRVQVILARQCLHE
jgi:hypothetical protein